MSSPARAVTGADFDRDVPLLIVKIGGYPLSHQGLAAVRSLGRVGVPVYTITEDRFTPQALSRHLAGRFVFPTTGSEPPDELVGALLEISARLGRRAIVLPTDDEAAILLAEHASDLASAFILPRIPPDLPRRVASKRGLHELSVSLGVPTPKTMFVGSIAAIAAAADQLSFPIVVKNADAWLRLSSPVIRSTTIMPTVADLLDAASTWKDPPGVVLQEHIPTAHAQDWVFHGYFGDQPASSVGFTGVKYRSWPSRAGVTSLGRAVYNPGLLEQSVNLCRRLGFRGIVDLDWRFDARDGAYKLLDFNPRTGANFRMFETADGIDVVRALHLDLTGRSVPSGRAVEGRGLIVEHLDVPSRIAQRWFRSAGGPPPAVAGRIEPAWFAGDDLLPFLAMLVRVVSPSAKRLARTASGVVRGLRPRWKLRPRGAAPEGPSAQRALRPPAGDAPQ